MVAVLKIFATLAVIVFMLNRKIKLGNAMLTGSAIIFLLADPTLEKLASAFTATFTSAGTWEIIFALYFVMCLEFQLRTGGIIDGFMAAARRLLGSERLLLALMPSFLGFLPSLGGAIFSAPLVESASKPYNLTAAAKTTINYWFRHVWEFTNPILTAMLLASQLTGFAISELVLNMSWLSALAFLLGWIFLIAPLKPGQDYTPPAIRQETAGDGRRFITLALGPIILNFALVVFFKLSAALSMAAVVIIMTFILRQNTADIRAMLAHALDGKLLWGIVGIIFFQNILSRSGIIGDITVLLNSSAIPPALVVGIISFTAGLLTGTPQGFVAITFPFIALIAPGSLTLVIIAFLTGAAGHMLSPAHMCLIVTLDYFDADFVKALQPVLLLEAAMIILVGGILAIWS